MRSTEERDCESQAKFYRGMMSAILGVIASRRLRGAPVDDEDELMAIDYACLTAKYEAMAEYHRNRSSEYLKSKSGGRFADAMLKAATVCSDVARIWE